MNTTTTKARQAIRRYIELQGFEIIENGWMHGKDAIDFIAREGNDLVFIETETHLDAGNGIPAAHPDRKSFERLVAAYLTTAEIDECTVRFDIVSLLVLNDSRGIIRHHRNALSEVG